MGNVLPGKLCRSRDACAHYRSANSKHGAATHYLLGALAHGPPNIREPWPDLVSWRTFKRFSASQDKIHFLQWQSRKHNMRLIQKCFYYVLGLMSGHLSDLAHACIAGCSASHCLSGDRDKHFAMWSVSWKHSLLVGYKPPSLVQAWALQMKIQWLRLMTT